MPGIPSVLNLLLQSQTFSNAAWTNTNSSVTSGVTAPDTTTTAFKLVENATGSVQHYTQQTVAKPTASLPYVFSFYIKSVERSKSTVQIVDGPNGAFVVVDVAGVSTSSLGTFGTGFAALSANIFTDAIATGAGGNGWYRCNFNITSSTANNIAPTILLSAAGGDTYTGDGASGFDIWGAQITPGSTVSSYTPTTTTALFAPLFPACMPEAVKRNPYVPDILINPSPIPPTVTAILQSQIWL